MSRFKSSQLHYIFSKMTVKVILQFYSFGGMQSMPRLQQSFLDLRCVMCYNLTVPVRLLFSEAVPYQVLFCSQQSYREFHIPRSFKLSMVHHVYSPIEKLHLHCFKFFLGRTENNGPAIFQGEGSKQGVLWAL